MLNLPGVSSTSVWPLAAVTRGFIACWRASATVSRRTLISCVKPGLRREPGVVRRVVRQADFQRLRPRGQRQHLTAGAARDTVDEDLGAVRVPLVIDTSPVSARQFDLYRLLFVRPHLHLAFGGFVARARDADVVASAGCQRDFERRLAAIRTVHRDAGAGGFRCDGHQAVRRLELHARAASDPAVAATSRRARHLLNPGALQAQLVYAGDDLESTGRRADLLIVDEYRGAGRHRRHGDRGPVRHAASRKTPARPVYRRSSTVISCVQVARIPEADLALACCDVDGLERRRTDRRRRRPTLRPVPALRRSRCGRAGALARTRTPGCALHRSFNGATSGSYPSAFACSS